jgi:hypothetical protein
MTAQKYCKTRKSCAAAEETSLKFEVESLENIAWKKILDSNLLNDEIVEYFLMDVYPLDSVKEMLCYCILNKKFKSVDLIMQKYHINPIVDWESIEELPKYEEKLRKSFLITELQKTLPKYQRLVQKLTISGHKTLDENQINYIHTNSAKNYVLLQKKKQDKNNKKLSIKYFN